MTLVLKKDNVETTFIFVGECVTELKIQVHLNELECREKVHFFLASYFKK